MGPYLACKKYIWPKKVFLGGEGRLIRNATNDRPDRVIVTTMFLRSSCSCWILENGSHRPDPRDGDIVCTVYVVAA